MSGTNGRQGSSTLLFVVYTFGVCFFFNICSYIEEWIKHYARDVLSFGWSMTMVDMVFFTIFAVIERAYKTKGSTQAGVFDRVVHIKWHVTVASAMIMSRALTNISIGYLNYPTQVIFKSLKLIAVMFGSILLLKKKFIIKEYISAAFMVVAAILFLLGDFSTMPVFNMFGVLIVLLSLVGDALHANSQELVIGTYGASIGELLIYTNAWAFVLCLAISIVVGELGPFFSYLLNHMIVGPLLFLRVLTTFGGALCYLAIMRQDGAVMASMVTTGRKISTVIMSFISFPKAWSNNYLVALLIFVGGVWLQKNAQDDKANSVTRKPTRSNNHSPKTRGGTSTETVPLIDLSRKDHGGIVKTFNDSHHTSDTPGP